jgi:hypothetical protein
MRGKQYHSPGPARALAKSPTGDHRLRRGRRWIILYGMAFTERI